jgi:3-(3-hydroxy-phenyl)propionate hydroxylase
VQDFDIAIVGCGPVGGLAANLLGKAGLKVVVIEREAEPHPLPRAVHIDHEMVRLIQSIGLVETILPLMRDTHGHMHIGADRGVIRYMGTAGRPRPYGWSGDYFFYQPEMERELRAGLARFASVDLRLGVTLLDLEQTDTGVILTVDDPKGRDTLRARWVIACDGASSGVRKRLDVRLDDLDFDEPWLVIDAEVDGPLTFPGFTGAPPEADLQNLSIMLCDPARPATIVPGRGNHRRWEFMLSPEEASAPVSSALVEDLIAPWVEGAGSRIVRAATYRFHALIAERWKDGRVFLAGDAAHQTPPFFGQGMCHGFRDVANLAWKLALVSAGRADETLLDTYQPEREPQVRSVIASAVEAGRYICQRDPELAADRDRAMRARANDPVRTAADLITPIRGVTGTGPAAGARFIQPWIETPQARPVLLDDLSGGGFVLLLSPDAAPVPPSETVRTLRSGLDFIDAHGDLQRWMDDQGVRAVLIRPDFYVFDSGPDGASLVQGLQAALAVDDKELAPCHG